MKVAIICYDLKNVRPYDNILVKAELAKFTNTATTTVGDNALTSFPDWIKMSFPDTTFVAAVQDGITSEDLARDVLRVIHSVGAEADKVYVAFVDGATDYLWNSKVERLSLT